MNSPTVAREPVRVAVLGGGAFGSAMALLAGRNGHPTRVYVRDAAQAEDINTNHRNSKYVGDSPLPEQVTATTSVEEACERAEIVFLALPVQQLCGFLGAHKEAIPATAVLVNTAKGLVVATKQLLSEAVLDVLARPYVVLSGPSFAKEIVEGHPTLVVCASRRLPEAVRVQRLLSSTTFRVYTSQDVVGVELGGALKNPLAIGAGIVQGLQFGTNTMAAFVTRASHELASLASALGGQRETVAGLSGVGDLMLTAFGALSRNRTCGMRLAAGEPLADITARATVEGVPTAAIAVHFADQCGLKAPIFRTVHALLQGELEPRDAATQLMSLELTSE